LAIGYDVIGDIHGYANKLEALLRKLGYAPRGKGYLPPRGRMAVFLGDLIDRGPEQLRVVGIVRTMVDAGGAAVVMGNHEFNAIGFATPRPDGSGECLRPNLGQNAVCLKNRAQHQEFIAQVGQGSSKHRELIQWFRTLPPFLELEGIRAVHACWASNAIATLKGTEWGRGYPLSDATLHQAYDTQSPVFSARTLLTCGMEIPLPKGRSLIDKSGHARREIRVANWRHWARELHEVALVPSDQEALLKGMEWPSELVVTEISGSPVFVGHHWFVGTPRIESEKFACLDWSAGRGGPLVAYRWDGEECLSNEKFVWVDG